MKTPSIEEVVKKFKGVKKIKTTQGNIVNLLHFDLENAHMGYNAVSVNRINKKSKMSHIHLYDYDYEKYAEIISYIEPTTKVRNSVLLQLAENNSFSEDILRKECPKLFENKLEVGKWYKRKGSNTIVFYQGKKTPTYGFYDDAENNELIFETHNKWAFNKSYGNIWKLATPQEVETALKNEFEKQSGIKFDYYDYNKTCNILYGFNHNKKSIELFKDGKWLDITPTDIITIVEKYGKDKAIKLVEQYKN